MHYSFGFLCACALSAFLLVGCGETVLCEGVVCEDDGNECTDGVCDPATGTCQHVTVEDDTACDFDGLPGLCKAGVCVDAMLCEGIECEDDGNECTDDVCDPATGMCGPVTVEDGTECSDGICLEGVCGPLCVANVCHCSEAGIRAAVEAGGNDPYTFNCDGPTTVTTDDEIEIDNDVILDGEGNLTVDGNETHRVFWVSSSVTAELRGMKVVRGEAREDGGGIDNDGMLTLTECEVSENAGRQGGGISNIGTLALSKTTVSSNSSQGDGGGIWNQGTLRLVDSTVADNTAAESGGGIENNSGSVELRRSTISGNTAEAGGGAAIESTGYGGYVLLQLINTTVSGNHPAPGRGAIEIESWAVVRSSTLQQLPVEDGRYLLAGGGRVELANTILHGECAWLEIGSYGGNIESPDNTCGLWYDPYYEQDWVDVSAAALDLGPLQNNGGPTLTHLPGQGSVALDRIEPRACVDLNWEPLETDQRGDGRPQGELCDVGSVEGPSLCGGVDCDDQNDCTEDRCNPADGNCSYESVQDGSYCDFGGGGSGGAGGIAGTGGSGGSPYMPGICFQGECIENPCAGDPCNDGNDCTWDDCVLPDGSCSYTNVPDGNSCMNGAGQCLGGACELYALCGAERSIPPTATTDSRLLNCASGVPVQIMVTMAVTPLTAVQEGPNVFETQFEFGLTPETVNELLQFGFSTFRVESLGATIDATEGDSNPTPVLVSESPVPCIGLLEWDTAQSIVTPTIDATWTLDDGPVLELTAQQFEEIVTSNGITETLTTEGPYANCAWETLPPAVSFTAAP